MNNDRAHLAKLQDYYARHRMLPSMPRLGELLGMSSTASVFSLVSRLKKAGYLQQGEDRRVAPTKAFFGRPLLGDVRAGVPEPAEEQPAAFITLDDYLVPTPSRTVMLRVTGDSMREAGILDGDIVVVERSAPAAPGDTVVAVVDGAYTVKTLMRDDSGFYLRAANVAYADIRPAGLLELCGVVTGVVRKMGGAR
jgi:repressor LexA